MRLRVILGNPLVQSSTSCKLLRRVSRHSYVPSAFTGVPRVSTLLDGQRKICTYESASTYHLDPKTHVNPR